MVNGDVGILLLLVAFVYLPLGILRLAGGWRLAQGWRGAVCYSTSETGKELRLRKLHTVVIQNSRIQFDRQK